MFHYILFMNLLLKIFVLMIISRCSAAARDLFEQRIIDYALCHTMAKRSLRKSLIQCVENENRAAAQAEPKAGERARGREGDREREA